MYIFAINYFFKPIFPVDNVLVSFKSKIRQRIVSEKTNILNIMKLNSFVAKTTMGIPRKSKIKINVACLMKALFLQNIFPIVSTLDIIIHLSRPSHIRISLHRIEISFGTSTFPN